MGCYKGDKLEEIILCLMVTKTKLWQLQPVNEEWQRLLPKIPIPQVPVHFIILKDDLYIVKILNISSIL